MGLKPKLFPLISMKTKADHLRHIPRGTFNFSRSFQQVSTSALIIHRQNGRKLPVMLMLISLSYSGGTTAMSAYKILHRNLRTMHAPSVAEATPYKSCNNMYLYIINISLKHATNTQ